MHAMNEWVGVHHLAQGHLVTVDIGGSKSELLGRDSNTRPTRLILAQFAPLGHSA